MDSVETRELTYFVTVAEELNFTRAAARLQIAQPPLSRAIQRLERRMGVTLLERTSRSVSLTPAGEVLLEEGRRALDAVQAAVRRTQRTARPEAGLVVAMKPGGDAGLLPGILAAYADEPDAVAVEVVFGLAERLMQLIALGRAVSVVPTSIRGHLRSDLVSVPVLDAPATTLVLAWPEGSRSRALAAFVRVASAVAARDHADAV
jgi:DNA-binding transcriptional LysR family regulator